VVPSNASRSASMVVASVPSKTAYFELPNVIGEAEVLVGAIHVLDTIMISQAQAVPEETRDKNLFLRLTFCLSFQKESRRRVSITRWRDTTTHDR
jgi:hypothetical protein